MIDGSGLVRTRFPSPLEVLYGLVVFQAVEMVKPVASQSIKIRFFSGTSYASSYSEANNAKHDKNSILSEVGEQEAIRFHCTLLWGSLPDFRRRCRRRTKT